MNPKQGDLIFIDAESHAGHEEGGHNPQTGNIRRPMVVLSNTKYNQLTGMVVCMPITSKARSNYKLAVPIRDSASGVEGTVITYQIPNYDYEARNGEVVGHISSSMLNKLRELAKSIF